MKSLIAVGLMFCMCGVALANRYGAPARQGSGQGNQPARVWSLARGFHIPGSRPEASGRQKARFQLSNGSVVEYNPQFQTIRREPGTNRYRVVNLYD
jgi:hypothetical protein